MNALDLVVLAVLAYMVVRGLLRGFADTLFSLLAWVLAFLIGKWGAVALAPLFGIANPGLRYFVGFAVVFLVVLVGVLLVGVLLVGHVIAATLRALGLGPADSVLGGAAALVKGLVVLTGLTVAAGLTALPQTDFWREAAVAKPLQGLAMRALPWLPAELAEHVRFDSTNG